MLENDNLENEEVKEEEVPTPENTAEERLLKNTVEKDRTKEDQPTIRGGISPIKYPGKAQEEQGYKLRKQQKLDYKATAMGK